MSRQATRGVQIENPLLCSLRDGFMRLLPTRLIVKMQDASLGG